MVDLIRFVDSIDAAPTVRLDINDESTFWVKSFSAPPPRLRRSIAANSMRDGVHVGSSTYDARTLVLEVECRKTTQDDAATEMQKLWRELDRESNYLMYQPQGASKPVFFALFRSDASQLVDVMAQAAMRDFTVELLAEPFALGLKETLGPYTINNDPEAASNPCYIDLPTILGDVAAPLTYWDEASGGATYLSRIIAMRSGTNAGDSFEQAEDAAGMLAGIDTANPGGGPDAAMSGSGTNNYMRTSFATDASMAPRLTWVVNQSGRFRVLMFVRRSANTGTINLRCVLNRSATALDTGESVTLPGSTSRQLVDLGVFTWPAIVTVGQSGDVNPVAGRSLDFEAERVSGTDTLDWDVAILIPAGDQPYGAETTQAFATLNTYQRLVVDGSGDAVYSANANTDPTTGGPALDSATMAGQLPSVKPDAANRLHVISYASGASGVCGVTTSTTVNLAYWPAYLHVRPVST